MNPDRIRILAGLLTLAALIALPFFFSNPDPLTASGTSGEPQVLTLITPHSGEVVDEFTRAFTLHMAARQVPVRVETVDVGGTGNVVRRLMEEAKLLQPGKPGKIDVLWGGGTDPYIKLADLDLLDPCPLRPELERAIPTDWNGVLIRPPHRKYYGAAFAGFGIIINREICAAKKIREPADWKDLADPAFFGRFANGDLRMSGAIKQCYESVLQACGWEEGWSLLIRIAGNSIQFHQGSGQIPEEVGMGNAAAGFAIDHSALVQVRKRGGERIRFVLPPMTVINPDAIAVLKGAPHPALAREFVAFVLSPAGQSLLFLKPGHPRGPQKHTLSRMPVLPELYRMYPPEARSSDLDPFQLKAVRPDGTPFRFDDGLASRRRVAMPQLAGAVLIAPHADLKRAWERVIRDGLRPQALRALTTIGIGAAEIERLETQWAAAPESREATLTRWRNEFLERYRRIAEEGQ